MPNRWKPNVTVAAVIERDGLFLLVEEHTSHGLMLNNPAGHLDAGESLEQACVREVLEETACDFVPQALVGIYLTGPGVAVASGTSAGGGSGKSGITYLRFAFRGELGAFHPDRELDQGIVRTVWLSPQQVRDSRAQHRSPLLLQTIEDYLADRRFPLEMLRTQLGATLGPA